MGIVRDGRKARGTALYARNTCIYGIVKDFILELVLAITNKNIS